MIIHEDQSIIVHMYMYLQVSKMNSVIPSQDKPWMCEYNGGDVHMYMYTVHVCLQVTVHCKYHWYACCTCCTCTTCVRTYMYCMFYHWTCTLHYILQCDTTLVIRHSHSVVRHSWKLLTIHSETVITPCTILTLHLDKSFQLNMCARFIITFCHLHV